MTRRATFSQLAWPEEPSQSGMAVQWALGISTQVIDWTWRAFDALYAERMSSVDLAQPLDQLERDLVRHHFVEIQILFQRETGGYAAFVPVHEWPEMETRSDAPAKPPAYDLAFISTSNQRWAWPVEAKVIVTPGALSEYLKDVNDKFVSGTASPLVSEGGMIGYLLCSDALAVMANLQRRIKQTGELFAGFTERVHRTSLHRRLNSPDLRIHHMLMVCVTEPGRTSDSSVT